jgi:hypothetical protein
LKAETDFLFFAIAVKCFFTNTYVNIETNFGQFELVIELGRSVF